MEEQKRLNELSEKNLEDRTELQRKAEEERRREKEEFERKVKLYNHQNRKRNLRIS